MTSNRLISNYISRSNKILNIIHLLITSIIKYSKSRGISFMFVKWYVVISE